ncbi:MAG: DUF2892 domain-containing protein [Zoogloeaceae bacterium]|jgi:hypothetical protein|nr:DUF2892 domain-containing protein [Zoogloeaceae bacterium]
MRNNVGSLDRALRVIVGLVLVALAATDVVGWWGWLGALPLATGLTGYCAAYSLLGVRTCPLKK